MRSLKIKVQFLFIVIHERDIFGGGDEILKCYFHSGKKKDNTKMLVAF